MEKDESNKVIIEKPQIITEFRRTIRNRHTSFRIALCGNKEEQLKNLSKINPKSAKRVSVITPSHPVQTGMFNFENEEADEEDEYDSDEESEESVDETTKNNINEKKNNNEKKQEKENKKDETEKDDEEKAKEEEGDDMPDYIDPLNEKGRLRIPLKTKNNFKKDDFEVIALSGKGAYGTVLKVKLKSDKSGKFYAIKSMDVLALDRIKKLYQAYLECDILSQLDSPYIVDSLGAFDENKKIYIVMQYLSKGDFSDFIRLNYPLKLDTIQFYTAEIVNFLDYIQSKKIVHRDLKPENIMMNSKWHLQVIDFATVRVLGKYFDKSIMKFVDISQKDYEEAVKNTKNDSDPNSIEYVLINGHKIMNLAEKFVGTPEYVSPEVLGDKPAGFGSDIWALGIMLYQMFYGKTPFKEKTNYLIFKKIDQLKIDFDPNVKIPEEAKDLIKKILVKDPATRLGAGETGSEYDIAHLKSHPFFKGINWDNLHNLVPPNSDTFDHLMNKKKDNDKNNINSKDNKNTNELGNNKTKKADEKSNDNKEKEKEKEVVLRQGYLDKKSPWLHYNKRKVILYSTPKLVYIDPSNKKIKGEIFLNKGFKIQHISMTIFDLISQKRSYRFRSCDGDVLVWEKSIMDAIKQYSK